MRGANDYVFFVRRQCEDISTLRCKTASCSEEPDCEWPKSAAGFEELRCTRCSGELALHWQREIDLCADHLEPLALGADTLDASFIESYGVWYSLCARATIGNKAFEAGATATTAPADVTEVPTPEDADGVPEQQMLDAAIEVLDDETLQDISYGPV